MKIKPLAFNFAVLFVSCLLTFVIAEQVFKSFFCDPIGLFQTSPLLGYEMVGDYDGCHKKLDEFDIHIKTNSKGHREREYGETDPDRKRVLFLGDSVTFGWGVEVEEAFPRRVEQFLRKMKGGSTIDVINTGVWGYNTLQELQFVQSGAGGYDPDLILVALTLPITVERNWYSQHQGTVTVEPLMDASSGPLHTLRLFCKNNSHICSFLDRRIKYRDHFFPTLDEIKRLLGYHGEAELPQEEEVKICTTPPIEGSGEEDCLIPDSVPKELPHMDAAEFTAKRLIQLREESRNINAQFGVVILPTEFQLWKVASGRQADSISLAITKKIKDLLQKESIITIDLTDKLSNPAKEKKLYLDYDFTHFNLQGHALSGQFIANETHLLFPGLFQRKVQDQ